MSEQTTVERVRYNLAGADKARKDAARYRRMHEATRGFGFPKRVSLSWMRVRAWRHFPGFGPSEFEMKLDEQEIDMFSSWCYERAQAEDRRAARYEQEALRVAARGSEEDR